MKRFILIILFVFCSLPLFAQKTFKVVYFHNFPPFSWKDGNEMKGIFIDVLNKVINKEMGISISHEGFPWARAQMYVSIGEADGFVTVPTEKRKEYTIVSKESVILSKVSIFTRENHPRLYEMRNIKNIKDFKNFNLITYVGDGFSKKLFQGWKYIRKVPTLDKCLELVKFGRHDIFLQTSEVTNFRIRILGYQGKFTELDSPVNSAPFNLCIGKKSSFKKILPEFDRIIKKMYKNKSMEKIFNKYR